MVYSRTTLFSGSAKASTCKKVNGGETHIKEKGGITRRLARGLPKRIERTVGVCVNGAGGDLSQIGVGFEFGVNRSIAYR